jgi:uncharacterized membrane protein YphA (DoxX/SURF4 family)
MSTSSLNVQPAVAAAARVLLAALFIVSGIQKLFVPDMIQGYIASAGLPVPSLVYAISHLDRKSNRAGLGISIDPVDRLRPADDTA